MKQKHIWIVILLLTWIVSLAASAFVGWKTWEPPPATVPSLATPAAVTTPVVALYQCDRRPMPAGVCAVDALGHVGPCHRTCGGIDLAAQARRHPWRLHAGPCLAR